MRKLQVVQDQKDTKIAHHKNGTSVLKLDRPVALGWIGTISLMGIAVAISEN